MNDDPALASIALQPDRFGENPQGFPLTMPTGDLELAKAPRVLGAELGGHLIDPVPLPLPLKPTGTFQFRHPVLAVSFDQTR